MKLLWVSAKLQPGRPVKQTLVFKYQLFPMRMRYIYIYIYAYIQSVSILMSQTFPGYSPPPVKQKVPINMGPKVNRFRVIDLRSCADTRLSIT